MTLASRLRLITGRVLYWLGWSILGGLLGLLLLCVLYVAGCDPLRIGLGVHPAQLVTLTNP